MFVSREDYVGLGMNGAVDELVIVGVIQDDLEPMIGFDNLRALDKKREEAVDLKRVKAGIQASGDAVVFIDDFRRANHIEPSSCPGMDDFRWSPAPEKAGNHHIGVNDD
jgi:hypothetical protein